MLDEMKSKSLCLLKRKKERGAGAGGGVRLVVWLMCQAWFLDRYSLPRCFWIQLVQQAEKQEAVSLEFTFPSSPHRWLNGGFPLKCLWPLEERGRGLIGLFCQIGHTTSTGTVRAHLPAAATRHVRRRAVVPTLLVLWVGSCSTRLFIFEHFPDRQCIW